MSASFLVFKSSAVLLVDPLAWSNLCMNIISWSVGWLCFTSHQQRGHIEKAPPFTVPCEGHEALIFTLIPPGIELRAVIGKYFL